MSNAGRKFTLRRVFDSRALLLGLALTLGLVGVHGVTLQATPTASPADLMHPITGAFTRYPYVEAYFSWRADAADDGITFYVRADRKPSWLSRTSQAALYPVATGADRVVGQQLLRRLERSEEHTLNSSHITISYAVFCLKKKN